MMPKNHHYWTPKEEHLLVSWVIECKKVREIAVALNRTEISVQSKLEKMGITLTPKSK